MRTGTVATTDNRNWELLRPRAVIRSAFSQSRAIALDMEAADHRRQRLPLPRALRHAAVRLRQAAARRDQAAGMANDFYRERVDQHLEIGLRRSRSSRQQECERLHSRKLRSFAEVAFQ